jgi:tetratricopeptide (TPR) repeat protein
VIAVPEPEVWIDEGPVSTRGGRGRNDQGERTGNKVPPKRPASRSSVTKVKVHAPLLSELVGAKRAERLEGRLGEAADAFAGERFGEARQILAPIAREVPDLPEARELYGLTLYRLGKWKDAARELDAFVQLSGGSTEQHPVLADCRRALQQYKEVDRLWAELREASPSGPLMTEGRIVAAGALADQSDLAGALRVLSKGFRFPKQPQEHHLRRAYALADLYERSGDVPQARALFAQIARAAPDFLDATDRAAGLG